MNATARRLRRAAGLLSGLALAAAAAAQDRTELDRTRIIGNRELPKVLHVMPWKRPLPGELAGRPPASLLEEAPEPVDPEVFRRQIRYHRALAPPPRAPGAD